MAQWGKTDNVANSVNWAAASIHAGSGKANEAANNTALYGNTTPDAFINGLTVGQFGASKAEMANTSGEGKKVSAPGWQLRVVGEGPIVSLGVGNGVFQNGETLLISNTSIGVNAVAVLTTNASGNLVSARIVSGGRFANSSVLVYTFTHEKHLANVTVTGGSTSYNNSDYFIAAGGNNRVIAKGNVSTNVTGYMTNTTMNGQTWANQVGLWGNATVNADVTFVVYAANGAVSNGTGATLVANLQPSTGGGVNASSVTLGGRAGRVRYETLVVMGSMTNGTSDDSLLPQ